MEGVQLRLLLVVFAFILCGCMISAQLCPTVALRLVSINTTEAVVVSSDEIDKPPANCTSATFDLNFIINDIGFLTSIDILELRSDHPDLELVVEFFPFDYEWPKFVVQENTYRRFILGAENPMPRLRLALNRRVGESHLNGSYSFRARVSLTSEADCGDDFICQPDYSLKVCLHPSAVCDGQVHCDMDYSDEINCEGNMGGPSVPRDRAVRNESIWVMLAHANHEDRQSSSSSVFSLHVTALNESVTCSGDEFLCDTGIQCVSNNARCDGLPNCDDYSDEIGCSDMCQPMEFACKHYSVTEFWLCSSPIIICDGMKQCNNLQDEIGCAPSCGSHVIQLQQDQTHQLLSPNAPASYSNNTNCVWFITAPQGTAVLIQTVKFNIYDAILMVGNGRLVDQTRIIWERTGGTAPLTASSEGNKVWATLEVKRNYLVDDAHFILELSVLDQLVNCSGEYEVACRSGYQCINESNVCDGIFHCWDKSDELSCGQCDSGLQCETTGDQGCLPERYICDGEFHCQDFVDEISCSSSFCGSERYISLEDYPDNTYNISSLETGFPPQTACLWIFTARPGYRILLDVKHQNLTDVTITTVGSGVDPTIESSQLGSFGGYSPPLSIASLENSMWVTFHVVFIVGGQGGPLWYQVSEYDDSIPCEEGQFKCERSSLCIPARFQCDGIANCADLSDEIGCDICNGQSTINITDNQVHILQANIEEDSIKFPNGKLCIWHILASVGHRIQLTIVELDLNVFGTDFVFSDGTRFTTGGDSFYQKNVGVSTIAVTSKTNNMLVLLLPTSSYSTRFTVELEQFEQLECGEGDVVCPSGLACIPEHEVCDGTPQCPLLGDEVGCGNCSSEDYRCDDVCISRMQRCNGLQECTDFSDEYNCLPCGKTEIELQNGTQTSSLLLSPNYPENYPNDLACFWRITADADAVISIEFSLLDLEQNYDNLIIGNGAHASDEASTIVTLTGKFSSVRVLTQTSEAWSHFKSDGSIAKQGFSCTISQINPNGTGVCRSDEFSCGETTGGTVCLGMEEVCNGYAICKDQSDELNCAIGNCGGQVIRVFDEQVNLTSPAFPTQYPSDTFCTWQIIQGWPAPLIFRVVEFALEDGYDFVTFSIGDSPGLIEVFTLTGTNSKIKSLVFEASVWVTFISDSSVAFRGFYFLIYHLDEDYEACQYDEFDCGNGLCIDLAAECNGFNDCRNNRDEYDCDDVMCPGAYKCDKPFVSSDLPVSSSSTYSSPGVSMPSTQGSGSGSISFSSSSSPSQDGYGSSRCVSAAKVCDGNFDCPAIDDETECDVKKCPPDCECNYREGDLNVTCANGWNSNSTLLSGVAVTTKLLQLSGVNISSLEPGTFKALRNLKVLSLKNNLISEIKQSTFASLDYLLWLDLSNTSLVELQENTFLGMPSLKGITIFDVPLETVRDHAFLGLSQLDTLILVRQDNNLPRLKFEHKAFDGLVNLKSLYVDDHRICCFFKDKNVECKTLEPEPPLFMCSNLMPNLVLKIFMWILGISALVGNIFVMIWRCREETAGRDSRKVHSLLVFNLAASDSLMGLYMMIIAIADVHFGNTYFEQSSEWQTSVPCRLAGFISIVASEASVFFLTLISIDRFLSIVFPFSRRHIRPQMGRIISALIWICTLIVGVVPTILAFDSSSDLYGLSDVCIGLPLMTKVARYETRSQTIDAGGVANITVEIPYAAEYRASWFFSIALFLGVNLLCFAVILICYICIFVSVKMSMKRVRRHKSRDDEVRMAIKMAAIVMTDFICWIPVIVMGILSQSRIVEIPPETYAWVVVFILPINSSLNPYLYTISDLCSQRRRSASTRKRDTSKLSNTENKNSNSMDTVFTIDVATSKHE
ncbi:uncharacterized protein LOC117298813 isoform X2 [Asterias rubens]|uniref:uncharacterized protein LOC117298813 isoform X2 n=1 Tax=Asterias rubens TaxID=7604 RepID=UPI0014550F05|nr:uncharacterized protein LOC117298813 isoform X2 [Asterias rubens]